MNEKYMHKKHNKIKNKVASKISKTRNIFMNLRTIINKDGQNIHELEKKYNGIIKHEKIVDGKAIVYCIRVLDNKNNKTLKYEVKYGISGVTIKISDNPHYKGIHFAHYGDFDCKNLKSVIFNNYSPDRIENYKLTYKSDGNIDFVREVIDRKDKNWIGKIFKYLRDNKYLLD